MKFTKMHGLGNDFVIFDQRSSASVVTYKLAAVLGHRRLGIGFDQLAVILRSSICEARLLFWNADGSQSATCGNATRCIARLLMDESGKRAVTLETDRGRLVCEDAGDGLTRVNMGLPQLGWNEIPLAEPVDTLHLPISGDPCAIGMGNPHCIFIVPDAEDVDLSVHGPEYETHPMFPERTNVEFISLLGKDTVRMRIWERGAGITLASGSGACAAAVAACRRGLCGREVAVQTDGGVLQIEWRQDGVWKTGPTTMVFDGEISASWIAAI